MAEPVILTLTITKDTSGNPVRDHTGKHPILHNSDTLKLHADPTSWPNGITEIKFYKSKSDYQAESETNSTSFATWAIGTSAINKDGTKIFDVSVNPTGSRIINDVLLQDAETNDDDLYYKVKVGDKWLDPEVVNKSGSGTGSIDDHWVTSTG